MHYLPSPADVPPVEGSIRKRRIAESVASRRPTSRSAGLVFKILADKHGDLYYVRIYSGRLKANSRVYNPGKDKKENAAQLWHIQADRREQASEAEAGDIVGVIGPRHFHHWRYALRLGRTDPAGIDPISGDGHLDGDRARDARSSAKSWATCWR